MQFPQNVFPLLIAYRIVVSKNGALLFYSSAAPQLGTLVMSIAPTAGTDGVGNSYPAGYNLTNGTGNIEITQSGAIQQVIFKTGNPTATGSFIEANTSGAGNAQADFLEISGPINLSTIDNAGLQLNGSSNDLTSVASAQLFYTASPVGQLNYVTVSFNGAQISAGNIVAVHPGTGTNHANVAVAETWQSAASLLTAIWTTAGANTPLRYRIEPYGSGGGVLRLDGEALTTGAGPWPAFVNMFTLPAGYRPATMHAFVTRSDIDVTAGMTTVSVLSSGGVQNGQAFTAAGQRLYFDGITIPLD